MAIAFLRLLMVTGVTVSALSLGAAEPPSQADIERHIVGKWTCEESADGGLTIHTSLELQKDGTFSSIQTMTQNGQSRTLTLTGRWEVSGANVTVTVDTSVPPAVPAGSRMTDEVLEINEKMCRLKKADGKERTFTKSS